MPGARVGDTRQECKEKLRRQQSLPRLWSGLGRLGLGSIYWVPDTRTMDKRTSEEYSSRGISQGDTSEEGWDAVVWRHWG